MIIIAKKCYLCGIEMPEVRDHLRANQGKYVITGVARRCRYGHLVPNDFEDEH